MSLMTSSSSACDQEREIGSVICPKPRRLGILNPSVGRREKFGTPVASSPPYFCGSPPSRASNPLIEDARFGDERIQPPCYSMGPPSPSSRVSGGCTRMKFGHTPAAVRIEGFDCLTRDRRSISAMA
ncbi:hypothetical protein ACFE04_005637 [Oxalis oulophora]